MTVSVSERLSPLYEGNGINTRFDFTFRVFHQEDASGVSVKHQVGADFENVDESLYTVTINEDNLGGYVNFYTAPEVGFQFYLAGETPVDQQLDITNYDNFYPDEIERSLDKLTAILQEWAHSLGLEKLSREKALEILDLAIQDQIRDQGLALDQIDAFAQDLANRLQTIVIERGWLAELIADISGKTQQEINNDVFSLTKTPAKRFTDFNTSIDSAPHIKALVATMPEGATLLIPAGKWAIKSDCTISKQINIRCDGEIVVDGSNPSAVFRMKRDPVFTLPGSALMVLPKKGDTQLSFVNPNLFDPALYYVVLNSTEIETGRIGNVDPYYKNETLDFIDSNFTLRGQIDLDYTDASKLTVRLYKKYNPINVQLRASYQPSVGQTTGLKMIEAVGYDHVIWDIAIDRTTSKNIAGSSFTYTNCVHLTFLPSCRISGGQSDYGDSYAFQNSCSSWIINTGISYFDCGVTSKKERGYAGRHGKYVLFDSCSLNGIDDHYGHHYIIRNMDFHNRGIGISGGHVFIENCNQYSATEPLYFIRTDTPYCDGELRIINCGAKVLLGLTSANVPGSGAKFKMFDSIIIRDIRAYIGTTNFINIGTFLSQNTNFQSDSFEITNIKIMRSGSGRFISDSDETVRFKKVSINNFEIVSDVVKSQIISRVVADTIVLNKCRDIDGALIGKEIMLYGTKHGYFTTADNTICATDKLILDDTEIVNDGGIYATRATQGPIYLYNSRINSWRFFAVAGFADKVTVSIGSTSNVNNPINFDLFSFNKLALDRVATANKTVGTLGVGLVTSISQVAVAGARIGDVVNATITSISAKGLRVNAWVDDNNLVKYYIENPTANPNGSQTITSVDLKFFVKSN